MKIKLKNGKLFIDGKEVTMMIMKDNSFLTFPLNDSNTALSIDDDSNVDIKVKGNDNTTTYQKNVIKNSTIIVPNGGFRLGDG